MAREIGLAKHCSKSNLLSASLHLSACHTPVSDRVDWSEEPCKSARRTSLKRYETYISRLQCACMKWQYKASTRPNRKFTESRHFGIVVETLALIFQFQASPVSHRRWLSREQDRHETLALILHFQASSVRHKSWLSRDQDRHNEISRCELSQPATPAAC